jgi:hypothetical protein
MELLVLIYLRAIGVTVQKDFPVFNVKRKFQTVLREPAQTELCAKTCLVQEILNVCAEMVLRERIVMLLKIRAPRMETLVIMEVPARPCHREGSPASVQRDGREQFAKTILMIV